MNKKYVSPTTVDVRDKSVGGRYFCSQRRLAEQVSLNIKTGIPI